MSNMSGGPERAHPRHLPLDNLRLSNVPPRVEAAGHECERLFRDRLGPLEVFGHADDGQGPRCGRVQMAAFLVRARIVQLCARPTDAVLIDLELFARLRM